MKWEYCKLHTSEKDIWNNYCRHFLEFMHIWKEFKLLVNSSRVRTMLFSDTIECQMKISVEDMLPLFMLLIYRVLEKSPYVICYWYCSGYLIKSDRTLIKLKTQSCFRTKRNQAGAVQNLLPCQLACVVLEEDIYSTWEKDYQKSYLSGNLKRYSNN